MILVIGGLNSGKLDFAKEKLGVKEYNDATFDNNNCIYNFQELVMEADFEIKLNTYLKKHPNCVIICNEVGGGVVPIDKNAREYREKVGRVCTKLAKQADSVYRVFCGIGAKIK